MKIGHYFVVMLLAVCCVVLTVILITMSHTNLQLQGKLQIQQQLLNQGILGQQAQQISSGVLQDLADSSVGNSRIRRLLEKHGYRAPSPAPPASDANSPETAGEKSTNAGEVKP